MSTTDVVPHGTDEPAAQADPAQGDPTTEPAPLEPAQATDWEAEARKWEKRAKENGAKAREFDEARKASMSESERAVAEAEARGRTAAAEEYGSRLARASFDAAAGRRNPTLKPKDVDEILELVDLKKFIGEDGTPDDRAIQAAVERLVPEAVSDGRPPSFDGGPRTKTPAPVDFNAQIRSGFGRT